VNTGIGVGGWANSRCRWRALRSFNRAANHAAAAAAAAVVSGGGGGSG
jgi:hypothetical protein